MNKLFLRFAKFALLIVFLGFNACQKEEITVIFSPDDFEGDVAIRWFDKMRDLTKFTPGFTPPVASRAFGYAGLALYEAVQGGADEYRSLSGQLTGFPELSRPEAGVTYYWPLVANAAMAYMAQNLYANTTAAQKESVTQLENDIRAGFTTGNDAAAIERSVEYGQRIATAVFEWSKTDKAHEGYLRNFPTTYQLPVGPGLWKPTSPTGMALQPFWGSNREFVPGAITAAQPPLPTPFSAERTSRFYQQMLEVYITGINLTAEERKIAQFWSDDAGAIGGTPPGHSISIANIVLRQEKANLMRAAETYARVGIALSDAFVVCWKCKYEHNTLRPITYIQEVIDPAWRPVINTPSFPEYTSGHATQSGAFAEVMTALFGFNYTFTDNTHVARTDIDGAARTYRSFFDAATESSNSRLYGGIHIREANERGLVSGRKIGEAVNKLRWRE
jgi:hypothetical protein